ncbi:prepilin-type N-terminal cleavage/methylation domain-containing protein [Phascolarctobacterium faecium]|uniref:prepilin-type N-terminal cleavage/methylation domain-containing protein n=1 Tax=Phascolarctobacterium faecium TaxID=33025 RepID=UPI0030787011
MKKQSGFTLIELVVAMAVLGLIMGAMVHLFGSSVTSLHVGARQEVVYEEARLLMNELKTTLRYADKDSIDPEQPTVSTSKFSYKGNLWDRHMDIAQGTNKEYKVTVEWKDDTKKQLQVTREDITDGSKKITIFPNDSNNSIFEGKFPVTSETLTLNDGNTVIMYKIALPLQYEFNGQMKTQTLETKVVPSKDEVTETPEEKMRREYMEILNTGKKIGAKEQLTSKEEKLRDDVYNFFATTNNTYYLTNNDQIRKYMYEKFYNGAWPYAKLTTATGETKTIYFNPVCHVNANSENAFIIGRDSSSLANSWVTKALYDHKRKQWMYSNEQNGISVMSKNYEELQQFMKSHDYQDVKKVEYN